MKELEIITQIDFYHGVSNGRVGVKNQYVYVLPLLDESVSNA